MIGCRYCKRLQVCHGTFEPGYAENRAMTAPTYLPELIDLLPAPGEWTEADYYPFSERGRLVELSDGNLEIIDLPTDVPPANPVAPVVCASRLCRGQKTGARPLRTPSRSSLDGTIRNRTSCSCRPRTRRESAEYWGVPDLAVEILSPGTAHKDREVKRKEYAKAGRRVLDHRSGGPNHRCLRNGETFHRRRCAHL